MTHIFLNKYRKRKNNGTFTIILSQNNACPIFNVRHKSDFFSVYASCTFYNGTWNTFFFFVFKYKDFCNNIEESGMYFLI